MKIVKINEQEDKINKKMVTKIGDFIYHSPNVDAVVIKIHFKDGSHMGFMRDEDEDELENKMGEMGAEEN